MNLPKVLFVKIENPGTDEQYFQTDTDAEGLMDAPPDEQTIGRYELIETIKAKTQVVFTISK